MTPEQTEELAALKAALKQHIDEAEKATPGPWTWKRKYTGSAEIEEPSIWLGESSSLPLKQPHTNAAFIARARTMSPLACRISLEGIKSLEKIRKTDCPCETYSLAEKDLLSILTIWKGGKV